jgi:hypothetical protein
VTHALDWGIGVLVLVPLLPVVAVLVPVPFHTNSQSRLLESRVSTLESLVPVVLSTGSTSTGSSTGTSTATPFGLTASAFLSSWSPWNHGSPFARLQQQLGL